jgi:integrase
LRLNFRLALLTGQRHSEVAGMRKCEINHDDKLWVIRWRRCLHRRL